MDDELHSSLKFLLIVFIQKLLRKIMSILSISQKPISILKNSTVSEVITKLLENNLSRLVVTENGKPIGIITEKDVGFFLFSETTKQGLENIPISRIMNQVLFVKSELSIRDAAKVMMDKGVSSLAIGTEQKIDGIITKTDLVRYYLNKGSEDIVVDFMTHEYVFTYTAAPLFKVIRKMIDSKISRIIVKDQNENPVGVISFRDFFRISIELGNEEDGVGFTIANVRQGFLSEKGFGNISLARDIMTKGLVTVKFNQRLSDACRLILENNVSGLAVLDGNESIAGIISKTDIIKAIAK